MFVRALFALAFLTEALLACSAQSSSEFRFTNIATNPSSGLSDYRRAKSRTNDRFVEALEGSLEVPLQPQDVPGLPWGTSGQPGVAVGDFNEDGFDDVYVTNGPGAANSLFINQFPKTGRVEFRDMAEEAGVAAQNQDSNGVCYGDLNNDGLLDFVVVSEFNRNRIFLNRGNGTWRRLSWVRTTGDDQFFPSTSCALGDVNNDGLLDLIVTSGVRKDTSEACLTVPYALNSPDQLFINRGIDSRGRPSFEETSLTSGINDIGGDVPAGNFTMSWTGTLVDINLDGNLDLVIANDQCAFPTIAVDPENGANRGAIRVQLGDGTGQFVSRTLQPRNIIENNRNNGGETWMGLGFGDFNCDGNMDLFGSNFGDYHAAKQDQVEMGAPRGVPGRLSSRWWLGSDDGDFVDASLEETGITVFGWGNAVTDYDNDGDQDIVLVGSLDFSTIEGSSNPNTIYRNSGCKAKFDYDRMALEPTGTLRNYQGLGLGDFNQDGYPDLVGASGFVTRPEQRSFIFNYSSPFDATAYFTELLEVTDSGLVWNGNVLDDGDMMLQMNKATDPEKCWVSIRPLGMQGIVNGARVNRGALGSTLIVRPKGMKPVMAPIVSGESFGSQHSPRRNFGLGSQCTGTVDILWPRGVRNRLYNIKNKEVLTVPEIPCSFDGEFKRESSYRLCVKKAILNLLQNKVVTAKFGRRLAASAMRARRDFLRA